MKQLTIIAVATAMLIGCADIELTGPDPAAHLFAKPEQVADDVTLCRGYHAYRTRGIRRELSRRSAVTEAEWIEIDRGSVFIGMSEAAAVCSVGAPIYSRVVLTAEGERRRWEYWDTAGLPRRVLHFEGGKLVAIER